MNSLLLSSTYLSQQFLLFMLVAVLPVNSMQNEVYDANWYGSIVRKLTCITAMKLAQLLPI